MIRLPIEQATPCLGHGDLFFPEVGEMPHAARQMCAGCYVRNECASQALQLGYKARGVWGASTEYDRGNKKGKQ